MSIVYLNGEFMPGDEAMVSVNDRGFLLGDACYEATPAYGGTFLLLDRHVGRLQAGLDAVQIPFHAASLEPIHTELLARNELGTADLSMVYVQVTRGVAARSHAFPPEPTKPTVYAFAKAVARATDADFEAGSKAIVVPDQRWLIPRIKSTNLLPNVLAQQLAVEADATDVVMHRDGLVTEGTHNNIFMIEKGVVVTPPADDLILKGVTRDFVLELAHADGVEVSESSIQLERLRRADEIFFTGTTTEIRPTVMLDGTPVGNGRVGPITRRVNQLFRAAVKPA